MPGESVSVDVPDFVTAPAPVILPASVAVTALFGAVLALPALRVSGPYLAMVTLAFGTIIQILINDGYVTHHHPIAERDLNQAAEREEMERLPAGVGAIARVRKVFFTSVLKPSPQRYNGVFDAIGDRLRQRPERLATLLEATAPGLFPGERLFFLIGLKVAQWAAGLVVKLGLRHKLDATISNFAANVVRILILALVIIATIVAFFPILAGASLGLKSADFNLLDLTRLYGASRLQTLWRVQLPTALPYLLSGMKTAGGLALIGAVVAEFVAGSGTATGLAWRIVESGNRLEIATLFAALGLLALTGILIFAALSLLEWILLRRWHESALAGES